MCIKQKEGAKICLVTLPPPPPPKKKNWVFFFNWKYCFKLGKEDLANLSSQGDRDGKSEIKGIEHSVKQKIVIFPKIKVSVEFREIAETSIFSSFHHIFLFSK